MTARDDYLGWQFELCGSMPVMTACLVSSLMGPMLTLWRISEAGWVRHGPRNRSFPHLHVSSLATYDCVAMWGPPGGVRVQLVTCCSELASHATWPGVSCVDFKCQHFQESRCLIKREANARCSATRLSERSISAGAGNSNATSVCESVGVCG